MSKAFARESIVVFVGYELASQRSSDVQDSVHQCRHLSRASCLLSELPEGGGRVTWVADVEHMEMEKLEEGRRYAGDTAMALVLAVCMLVCMYACSVYISAWRV